MLLLQDSMTTMCPAKPSVKRAGKRLNPSSGNADDDARAPRGGQTIYENYSKYYSNRMIRGGSCGAKGGTLFRREPARERMKARIIKMKRAA